MHEGATWCCYCAKCSSCQAALLICWNIMTIRGNQQLSWVIHLTHSFGLPPAPPTCPMDSNKISHQGFAKEISRYFFIAGLPVTGVKSLWNSRNLFCGAVSIGKVHSWLFVLGSACADSTSCSFDSFKALSKYLSQTAFAQNLWEQNKLCNTICQHACEKSLLDACHSSA